jgi:hypothetical protein
MIELYTQLENSRAEKVDQALGQLEKALGANGQARLADLGNWFVKEFGQDMGEQLRSTLWNPSIVQAFEKLRSGYGVQAQAAPAAAAQQPSRVQPRRTDGKPDDWDSWDARSQRTWQIEQSMRRHA